MLQPELRKRSTYDIFIPSINLVEPKTIFNYLEIVKLVRVFGYVFHYRVLISITIEFITFLMLIILLYLEMFNLINLK
jgi:hypothetical protein